MSTEAMAKVKICEEIFIDRRLKQILCKGNF